MNVRKRVTRFGKRTSCFPALSWQQNKQYKGTIDKQFLKDPQMHMCPLSTFHSNQSCRSGVECVRVCVCVCGGGGGGGEMSAHVITLAKYLNLEIL